MLPFVVLGERCRLMAVDTKPSAYQIFDKQQNRIFLLFSSSRSIFSAKETMAPPPTNKESEEQDILPRWMDQFGALKRFIKKHDRLPYMDENKALCKWAWRQQVLKEIVFCYTGNPIKILQSYFIYS
jgi:hypothetical protein